MVPLAGKFNSLINGLIPRQNAPIRVNEILEVPFIQVKFFSRCGIPRRVKKQFIL